MIAETDILVLTPNYVAHQLSKAVLDNPSDGELLEHTRKLVAVAENIGRAVQLGEEDQNILILAAWFYDLSLTQPEETTPNRKFNSINEFLTENGLSEAEIAKVTGCLSAAQFPQRPQNIVEEAFCDAVASFLAAPDYLMQAEKQAAGPAESSVEAYDWVINQKELLKKQAFFTKYGKNNFSAGKAENLKLLKKKGKALTKENKELEELWEENKKFKRDLAKEKEQKVSRGIETMFRTTMASHLQLSVMADMKANLLISINAIIASIMISSFLRNIDEVPHLIIPSVLLTLVCLLTIVFAVLSTKPNIKASSVQPEDADLLFFGNFVRLSSEAYKNGIRDIMRDHDKLYNTMIDNIYLQGKVLSKKYRLLQLAYSVFMIGFGIVLVSYTIAYLFFAE